MNNCLVWAPLGAGTCTATTEPAAPITSSGRTTALKALLLAPDEAVPDVLAELVPELVPDVAAEVVGLVGPDTTMADEVPEAPLDELPDEPDELPDEEPDVEPAALDVLTLSELPPPPPPHAVNMMLVIAMQKAERKKG